MTFPCEGSSGDVNQKGNLAECQYLKVGLTALRIVLWAADFLVCYMSTDLEQT